MRYPLPTWSTRRAIDVAASLRADATSRSSSRPPGHRHRGERASSAVSCVSRPVRARIYALVTRRERTVAVYCKRTGETVPCTRLIIADDTMHRARVTLWRTHASVDVGASRRRTMPSVVVVH